MPINWQQCLDGCTPVRQALENHSGLVWPAAIGTYWTFRLRPLVRQDHVGGLHASSTRTVVRGFRLTDGQSHTDSEALSCRSYEYSINNRLSGSGSEYFPTISDLLPTTALARHCTSKMKRGWSPIVVPTDWMKPPSPCCAHYAVCAGAQSISRKGDILEYVSPYLYIKKPVMNLHLTLEPLVSLLAGVLILMMPKLLNYIVASYLIVIGMPGLVRWRFR